MFNDTNFVIPGPSAKLPQSLTCTKEYFEGEGTSMNLTKGSHHCINKIFQTLLRSCCSRNLAEMLRSKDSPTDQ